MNFSSYGIRELLVAAGFGIATSMDVRTMMQTPKFMRGALALRREDLLTNKDGTVKPQGGLEISRNQYKWKTVRQGYI